MSDGETTLWATNERVEKQEEVRADKREEQCVHYLKKKRCIFEGPRKDGSMSE